MHGNMKYKKRLEPRLFSYSNNQFGTYAPIVSWVNSRKKYTFSETIFTTQSVD